MTKPSQDKQGVSTFDASAEPPAANEEFSFWWQFACDEDVRLNEVARWERIPTPTAGDLAIQEAGLARAKAGLAEHREHGELAARQRNCSGNNTARSSDATPEPASYFDPVTVAELETMFPAAGKWARWAERASENGLKTARVGRGRFNPYAASQWFLGRGEAGWDHARVDRVLARNLPVRSHDKRDQFAA